MLVCSKCGGTNVQVLAWVDANTNEYISEAEPIDTWCEDCDIHIKLKEETNKEELK